MAAQLWKFTQILDHGFLEQFEEPETFADRLARRVEAGEPYLLAFHEEALTDPLGAEEYAFGKG